MKKILILVPIVLAVLTGCGADTDPSGTPKESTVFINSLEDFKTMVSKNPITSETTKSIKVYSLNVDLDFQEIYPELSVNRFDLKDVEFLGNNHIFRNINVNVTKYGGLFAKTYNCTFTDLVLENCSIQGSSSGALVGSANQSTFNNIKIQNTVSVGDGVVEQVGGLVGYGEKSNIKYCENNALVRGGKKVGGIIGDSYNSSVSYCVNNAEISAISGSSIGGIAGSFSHYWRMESHQDLFEENTNNGAINAPDCDNVGGLVGDHVPSSYPRSTNYPTVSFSKLTNNGNVIGNDNVGGISGTAKTVLCNTNFTKCTNKGTVLGREYVGGIVGKVQDTTKRVSFTECTNELNQSSSNYVQGELYVGGISGVGASFLSCKNSTEVKLVKSASFIPGDAMYTEYQHSIGGIVGYGYAGYDDDDENNDKSEFRLCENSGKISGYSDTEVPYKRASSIGGICGLSVGGSFFDCSNSGELNGTQCVGGIIGTLIPKSLTTLRTLSSTGKLILSHCGGGIVGDVEASSENYSTIQLTSLTVQITNAEIYGSTPCDVVPYKYVVGGLIGRATTSAISEDRYQIGTLAYCESHFSYTLDPASENMKFGAAIGYNRVSAGGKPLIRIAEGQAAPNCEISEITE